MIAESIGRTVVDFNELGGYEPAIFGMDPGGSIASNDHLGLAVLLHVDTVNMRMIPNSDQMERYGDDVTEDAEWKPNQVLCFMDKALQAKKGSRIFFFLVLIEVVPIGQG